MTSAMTARRAAKRRRFESVIGGFRSLRRRVRFVGGVGARPRLLVLTGALAGAHLHTKTLGQRICRLRPASFFFGNAVLLIGRRRPRGPSPVTCRDRLGSALHSFPPPRFDSPLRPTYTIATRCPTSSSSKIKRACAASCV